MISVRPKSVLTADQARDIFGLKHSHESRSFYCASTILGRKYQVSSKAIRDIWKGRSWLNATYDLWDLVDRPLRRNIGRPKGKKDSRPRNRTKFEASQRYCWLMEGEQSSLCCAEQNAPLHSNSKKNKEATMCETSFGSFEANRIKFENSSALPSLPSIHSIIQATSPLRWTLPIFQGNKNYSIGSPLVDTNHQVTFSETSIEEDSVFFALAHMLKGVSGFGKQG